MTVKTKSTIKMICVRAGIANDELPKEAQRLLLVYEDPSVSPEVKSRVKAKLDEVIRDLEERVTTRRLREAARAAGIPEEQAG